MEMGFVALAAELQGRQQAVGGGEGWDQSSGGLTACAVSLSRGKHEPVPAWTHLVPP